MRAWQQGTVLIEVAVGVSRVRYHQLLAEALARPLPDTFTDEGFLAADP